MVMISERVVTHNRVIEKLFEYELIDFELLHVVLHLYKFLCHGHDSRESLIYEVTRRKGNHVSE